MAHDYWIKETRKGYWADKEEKQFMDYNVEIQIDGLNETQVLRVRDFVRKIADE